jgi:hypothetical protein
MSAPCSLHNVLNKHSVMPAIGARKSFFPEKSIIVPVAVKIHKPRLRAPSLLLLIELCSEAWDIYLPSFFTGTRLLNYFTRDPYTRWHPAGQ